MIAETCQAPERQAATCIVERAGSQACAVRLTVNGEERSVSATSLNELVARLGLDGRKVAIERNLAIVPRSLWGATVLDDGDRIEIVQFVGGG
jgi:thiamine biosynthesis protein ThiS